VQMRSLAVSSVTGVRDQLPGVNTGAGADDVPLVLEMSKVAVSAVVITNHNVVVVAQRCFALHRHRLRAQSRFELGSVVVVEGDRNDAASRSVQRRSNGKFDIDGVDLRALVRKSAVVSLRDLVNAREREPIMRRIIVFGKVTADVIKEAESERIRLVQRERVRVEDVELLRWLARKAAIEDGVVRQRQLVATRIRHVRVLHLRYPHKERGLDVGRDRGDARGGAVRVLHELHAHHSVR